MNNTSTYKNIARRTGGDIYIGVVGPVRTGKSSFIKKFMETLVLPNISSAALHSRAIDELPQSSAGKTIMTTEPKFIPEEAVRIELPDKTSMRVRMIDCVGYIVDSALGYIENEQPRMIVSPWYKQAVPFDVAAETGTRKVITEHSTIGIVVTTDGSISDIPRSDYEAAERRVVAELTDIGKPFVVLLNCVEPASPANRQLAAALAADYGVSVIPVNCLELTEAEINNILLAVTREFPVKEIAFDMPRWVAALEKTHWLQKAVYASVADYAAQVDKMRDVAEKLTVFTQCEYIADTVHKNADLGTGEAQLELVLQPGMFYRILGEMTGLEVNDEAGLMTCLTQLFEIKRKYKRIESALQEVEATGYGIVMPSIEEMQLREPEMFRQGNRYGVKLGASAPSIHMMRADITTEIAPVVGSEQQSEALVKSLLGDFNDAPIKIWESNIFGKSLNELVNEGLQNKLYRMPADVRQKLQHTLERIIDDGCAGLICIIF